MKSAVQLRAKARAAVGRRGVRLALYGLGGFIVLVAVLGFLVVPPIARSQLEKQLAALLHRPVSVERVRINPFVLSVEIDNLVVKERDGAATAASFEKLVVNLSASSIFRLAPVVEEVVFAKPYVRVIRNDDKTYNFQDLIDEAAKPPSTPPAPPGPPPRFAVYNISVVDGRVDFDDRPERAQHAITGLRIGIPFISSLPSQIQIKVKPELAAVVNGAPLVISGETRPFMDTQETVLQFDLKNVSLPKYVEYSPVPLRFRVPSGKLDARLMLSFAALGNKIQKLTLGGNASLQGLAVRSAEDAPLFAMERLDVELEEIDVVARKASVKRVHLARPSLDLVRRNDGSINLVDALPAAPAKAAEQADAAPAPFLFSVAEIALTDGTVRFTDQSLAQPFHVELQKIGLGVTGLSNVAETKGALKLALDTSEKAHLDYAGQLQLVPMRGDGELKLTAFDLKTLVPYVQQALNLDIPGGTFALDTRVQFAQQGENVEAKLEGLGVTLSKLQLDYRDGNKRERLWDVGAIEVRETSLDLATRQVTLGDVRLRDAKASIKRESDGSTLYTRLVKTATTPANTTPPPAAAPWRIDAKRLAVENAAVTLDDRVPATAARTSISKVAIEVRDFSTVPGSRAQARVQASVNAKGSIAANGSIRPKPLAGTLALDIRGLELPAWQAYLEPFLAIVVTDGAVSTKGTATFEVPEGQPVRATYRGDLSVNDLATLDAPSSQDLLKWKTLKVNGIDFELEPLKVSLNEITLADYYSRLILNADATLNLQKLLKKADGPASAPPPTTSADSTAQAGLPSNVRIGKIRLQNGKINFSDFFIRPNYSANLIGVDGELTEMTPTQTADLALHGQVNQGAPLEINGKLNVLAKEMFLDLKASARDIELSPLTPYAAKYAGYGIEKGKLSVNVTYKVENRKLSAENNVILDQLTFGDRIDSPTATKLPVLLAVALLKDRNGVIDLNVPISGSLDDPQFSVGPAILRVIGNLIVKAVTAPFALLGSLFGGGAELAYLEYKPGSAQLDDAALAKLKSLAAALTDRQGLKIEVSGRVDAATDPDGLKREALLRQVRAQKLKETVKSGATGSLDDVRLEPGEYEKYLPAAYKDAKFERPRNALGVLKDVPREEMERLMLANVEENDAALRLLAVARGQAAKDWLVGPGKVATERVFLVAPKLGAEGITDKGKPTRCDFVLK